MRAGYVAVGIVLLLVGLGVAGYVNYVGVAVRIPVYPNAETYSPNGLGPLTLRLSWSGAPSSTVVTFGKCTDSLCHHVDNVTTAVGSSGTITADVSGGDWYAFTAANLEGAGVDATVQTMGLTYLTILGLVIGVAGIGCLAVGLSSGRPPV